MSITKVFDDTLLDSKRQEVIELQKIENEVTLEIGRILSEVKKTSIPTGKWTEWLESIGYNARTARRYIQVYEQFRDVPAARQVPFSKLVELLPLPVDVDRSTVLNEVKDESVRKIREKVKEINGGNNKRSDLQDKPVKPPREYDTTKVRKSVASLQNLIPQYTALFESGDIDIEKAVEIGGFSKETQELMSEYEKDDSSYSSLIGLLVESNFSTDDIHRCIFLTELVLKNSHMYKEVDDTVLEICERLGVLLNDERVFELYECLIEYEKRVNELDKEYAARGTDINRVYLEKVIGMFGGGGSSKSKIGQIKQSANVKQILGVSEDADADEMKKQYRSLMKVLHPDVGGSAYLFQLVKDAYDSYTGGNI